jgi:hypothetical protein
VVEEVPDEERWVAVAVVLDWKVRKVRRERCIEFDAPIGHQLQHPECEKRLRDRSHLHPVAGPHRRPE